MSSNESIPIWQVDAFADRPFTGNPAAVCILENYPNDSWMQSVAAEINLSETSFLVPSGDINRFALRWFTPTTEVDLCGHATLAAAHIVLEQGLVNSDIPIRFQTRSGELTCTRAGTRITLDFPATAGTTRVDHAISRTVLDSLGIDDGEVLQAKFDLVVFARDSSVVEALAPNFNSLKQVQTRGVIVTALSQTSGVDFVSRFFAPRCGIDEDPVTGSAHCFLAPYWSERIGKTSLVGYQASSRGGTVHCEVLGERVRLTGNAVTVLEGRLLLSY